MIFIHSVTAMNLHIVAAMLLFFGAVKGANQALRTGEDEIMTIPENNSEENPSRVMALVIVEDTEESEETNPSVKPEAMLPWIESPEIMLPWLEDLKPRTFHEETSGESNSDEYSDSDTVSDSDTESASNSESDIDSDSDTDKESYYYHEDDFLKNKIMKNIVSLNLDRNISKSLRNRWKSCQKKASKYCRKACVASYKTACSEFKCKKKMKKLLKKQCKVNCKDFFIDS